MECQEQQHSLDPQLPLPLPQQLPLPQPTPLPEQIPPHPLPHHHHHHPHPHHPPHPPHHPHHPPEPQQFVASVRKDEEESPFQDTISFSDHQLPIFLYHKEEPISLPQQRLCKRDI